MCTLACVVSGVKVTFIDSGSCDKKSAVGRDCVKCNSVIVLCVCVENREVLAVQFAYVVIFPSACECYLLTFWIVVLLLDTC